MSCEIYGMRISAIGRGGTKKIAQEKNKPSRDDSGLLILFA